MQCCAVDAIHFTVAVLLLFEVGTHAFDARNIEKLTDQKSLKKLLRVRTNVLILFVDGSSDKDASLKTIMNTFSEAATQTLGIATMAIIDCDNSDGKKLCKKLKVQPQPFLLKHYLNGEYHMNYERQLTAKSIARFMNDPTGDIPWDEDPSAANVVHIDDGASFRKLLAMGKPTLVMFYAPWCGHCKLLKPEYSAAANELRGSFVLAAIDATHHNNEQVARAFHVEAFPTLHYFERGEHKFTYSGPHSKEGIMAWLKNPTEKPPAKEREPDELPWSDVPSEVVHLGDEQFDEFIASHASVLVMFYAPWCGHCKKAKPEYTAAAELLKKEGSMGILAAVDATVHRKTAEKVGVEGYPTFAYFKEGKFAWKINERTKDGFYAFMKNPIEPPSPELPWKLQEGSVLHLDVTNFKSELKKKKDALVMFYAPWCQFCQRAKPFFSEAARQLADESRIVFAAVDCTSEISLCREYDIQGYPTIIYLSYGKNRVDYSGAHDTQSLMDYVKQAGGKNVESTSSSRLTFVDAVKVISKGNLNDYTFSGESIVMFFKPSCKRCEDANSAFNAAAEKVENGNFVAVDCTQNEGLCKELRIEKYPTFKFFTEGKVRDYLGEPSFANFVNAFARTKPAEHAEL
uniref:Thioredoxin domain-containing protein n=1 Tax=Parascaris univalens TaxID=6257 RepID=A0A915C2V3_PARUN